tara:strand:+ start:388 stop:2601 length:2214 start_codon:yes stop_codon:yes gene_type:complete
MSVPDFIDKTSAGFSLIEVPETVRAKAIENLESWLLDGRFEDSFPQLDHLLQTGSYDQLFDAFFQQLPFGTSGRRGPIGFGSNRFNPFTLGTSIQGHCDFIKLRQEAARPSVVIAYDVRIFNDLRKVYNPDIDNPLLGMYSKDFARIAARIYAANGIKAWFPPGGEAGYVTTPELSFAIRSLEALGGLNISASHNHPDDNGAKIYNAAGAQEVPPLDQELAELVKNTAESSSIPWETAVRDGLIETIPTEIHERYIQANLQASIDPSSRSARVAFTPLHGTGGSSVEPVLAQAGFKVSCPSEQATPDGAFPTVPFRTANPEVPESMDLVTGFARKGGLDLALATDPDADRLGVTAPDAENRWSFLNGNQIGLLLAAYLLDSCPAEELHRKFCVSTTVTSSLLDRLVRQRGAQSVAQLPTGFKYICEVLAAIESRGRYLDKIKGTLDDFLLGTEESHGYLVTNDIRDKDAAGASLLLAELSSTLKDRGSNLLAYLDELYLEFGYTSTQHVSTVMLGAGGHLNIRAAQKSLREKPPGQINDQAVEDLVDYRDEEGTFGPILCDSDRVARNILEFRLADGARLIARPSGTEPKHKIYAEVSAPPIGTGGSLADLQSCKAETDALARELALGLCAELLDRIGISMPRWALEISDLVPLEWKRDFSQEVLPKLVSELTAGKSAGEVEEWVDQRLEKYGADGRLLVRDAVSAYCRQVHPDPSILKKLERLFAIESSGPAEQRD